MKCSAAFLRIILLTIFIWSAHQQNCNAQGTQSPQRAGLRSSIYGIDPFPDSTWWVSASTDMASRFGGSSPAVIWILGYTTSDGCYLGFPKPHPDSTYTDIYFSSTDTHESYLDAFDKNGVKVWLQVESGQADIVKLIDLVLSRYSHHPCVIGFGVDVEWYKESTHNEGKAVTDAEAQAWSSRIKSYNSDYLLFTKHWLKSKMPPTFRTDMVFLDDSQIFSDMDAMVDEFVVWANHFSPAKVAFQYGYDADKSWWEQLSDPPGDIGDEIINRCSNTAGLYWVDFNAYEIWPEDFTSVIVPGKKANKIPAGSQLHQNYPNPFNPETLISYSISQRAQITIDIFDIQGRLVKNVYNGVKDPGEHKINVRLDELGSGVYICRLRDANMVQYRKMTLLK